MQPAKTCGLGLRLPAAASQSSVLLRFWCGCDAAVPLWQCRGEISGRQLHTHGHQGPLIRGECQATALRRWCHLPAATGVLLNYTRGSAYPPQSDFFCNTREDKRCQRGQRRCQAPQQGNTATCCQRRVARRSVVVGYCISPI